MNNFEEKVNPANFKLRRSNRFQVQFQEFAVDDLIPLEHKARIIADFVSQIDLTACFKDVYTYDGASGRSMIDPQILLTLWVYSILDGNISGRKLEELCKNHNVYKWILGGVTVNRTNLNQFRSRNPRMFDDLLTKSLAVMVKNGLIEDTDFAQDGTKIKANAGNNTFHKEDTLIELQNNVTEYIAQLKIEEKQCKNAYEKRKILKKQRLASEKEAKIKAAVENLESTQLKLETNAKRNNNKVTEDQLDNVRASIADPGVRRMKMGDSGFRLAYNIQFSTGLNSRVIYGVDAVNDLDPRTPPRLMLQVQERLKKLGLKEIAHWIADVAYASKVDIITAALLFPNCIYFAPPKNSKKNAKKHSEDDCEAIKDWKDRIGSEPINKLYKKRCSTAEFSNMHIKNCGLKEFCVRGLLKVKGMATLHAIAHNVARFIDLTRRK
jgi:transposase